MESFLPFPLAFQYFFVDFLSCIQASSVTPDDNEQRFLKAMKKLSLLLFNNKA